MRRRTEIWFRNLVYAWILAAIALVGLLTGASWPVLLLPTPLFAAMFLWPPPPGWEEELPRIAYVYRLWRRDGKPSKPSKGSQ